MLARGKESGMRMQFQRNSGFLSGPVLIGAALGMFIGPPQLASGDEPPETITVTGVVRDFIECLLPGDLHKRAVGISFERL